MPAPPTQTPPLLPPAPPSRPLALAALLALAACGRAPEPAPGAGPRPNVLLVSVDTLRADHLGCYGYGRQTSPHLDGLAAQGVIFEDCTSTTSWTLPAHLSMLTGLPVSGHGICDDRLWTRVGEDGQPLAVPLHGAFLPEVLHGAGYRTGGFYTWKYLEPRFGFGPGFEVYERLGHTFFSYPPVARRFEELRAAGDVEGLKALAQEYPALFDSTRPSSPETVDRALAWMDGAREESPDRPFFCFVHLFDVHDPYTPPAPYDARFTDPGYSGPIDGQNVTAPDSPVRADMAPRDLEQLIALYDGEIAWVDAELGRLLRGLEERGLERDTLVVLTSDHGEEFFEHGDKTHRHALHRESVHVPLVMRWPAGLPAGARISGPVGLIDIAPTVAALCGLAGPPGATGHSLVELARGAADPGGRRYVSELLVFEGDGPPLRRSGLREGSRLDLLEARGRAAWEVRRHDLAHDPRGSGAGAGLSIESPDGQALLATLDAWRARVDEARGRTPVRAASEELGLDALDVAELEGMGYVGVGVGGATLGAGGEEDRLCLDGCAWSDGGAGPR